MRMKIAAAWIAAAAGAFCQATAITVVIGRQFWWLWPSDYDDGKVRVPEIGVVYQVPHDWVRASTEARAPEYLTSVVPVPRTATCSVGEMVPGDSAAQVWDAAQRGEPYPAEFVSISQLPWPRFSATVVDGRQWQYTFVRRTAGGRYVYAEARWSTPQDREAARNGCFEVVASLEITDS